MIQRIQRAAMLASAALLVLSTLVLAFGIDRTFGDLQQAGHGVYSVVIVAMVAVAAWRLWRWWLAGALLLDLGWAQGAVAARFVGVAWAALAIGALFLSDHNLLAFCLFNVAWQLAQGLGRAQIRERGIVSYPQYIPWRLIAFYTLSTHRPDFVQTSDRPEHVFLSLRFKRRWFRNRSFIVPGDQREALEHVLGRYVAGSSANS
jgi:hypothetical protein